MMTFSQLLEFTERHNVSLTVHGDTLHYDAPAHLMKGEPLDALREHKTELLTLLKTVAPPALDQFPSFPNSLEDQETGKLEFDLLNGMVYLFVECAHLDGETVVFAADTAVLPLDKDGRVEGCVVYRVSELQRFRESRPSIQVLKTIHAAKKELGGEYTEGLP